MRSRAIVLGLALGAISGALAGCARASDDTRSRGERTVVAAFYPLAWAAEQVAGEDVDVVDLTPPGAEPHDLELSPADLETIRDAELVVYVSGGFQPAVEDAVADREGRSLDVLGGDPDPHVWLDPRRLANAAEEIATALGEPGSAAPLLARLLRLDRELRSGLARCERRDIVTSHAAFGHLARAYGLRQVALAGISPEAEPTPRALEGLVDEVERAGVTTVFFETLASPRVAETVARETGARTAVLDPLEGLSEERLAAGDDYLSVMRRNLRTLREALGCR